jgi:cell shape-determining protein MreC
MDAASVVERGLLVATGGISDVLQRYVTSVASYEELLRLRREELVASARATRIRELEHENEVLRGLAGVAARLDGPRPIGARVIGRSGAPLTRLIRVDRGGYDGIERGDGVITARGVMGRVLAAGRHSSDVLLLTDPASAVDVTSQRTRARGKKKRHRSAREGAKFRGTPPIYSMTPLLHASATHPARARVSALASCASTSSTSKCRHNSSKLGCLARLRA